MTASFCRAADERQPCQGMQQAVSSAIWDVRHTLSAIRTMHEGREERMTDAVRPHTPSDMRTMSRMAPSASAVEFMYVEFRARNTEPLAYLFVGVLRCLYCCVWFVASRTSPFARLPRDSTTSHAHAHSGPCTVCMYVCVCVCE
jgi:hypothetical protein